MRFPLSSEPSAAGFAAYMVDGIVAVVPFVMIVTITVLVAKWLSDR